MAHRTEGEDNNPNQNGTGKRGFQPANPPTTGATRYAYEDANMTQEELCNVIELTGGTVNIDAAADRAAGFRQVYDTIFESGNITDAAMSDVALDKCTGESDQTVITDLGGGINRIQRRQINSSDIQFIDEFDDNTQDERLELRTNTLLMTSNDGVTAARAEYTIGGIDFDGQGKFMKFYSITVFSSNWSGPTNKIAYIETAIPITKKPVMAMFTYDEVQASGDPIKVYDAPSRIIPSTTAATAFHNTYYDLAQYRFVVPTGSSVWHAQIITNTTEFSLALPTKTNQRLLVWYHS